MSGDNLTIVLFLIGTATTFAVAARAGNTQLIGGLFGLAGIFAIAGLGWPIIQSLSPPVTAIVNQVATSPVAWFVVLMLGIGAALLRPPRGARISSSLEQTQPIIRPGAIAPPAASVPISLPATIPVPKPQRVLIDVTPSYLMGLYENRTSLQGDALAVAYIGKRMTVTGQVLDISQASASSDFFVQFRDNDNKYIAAHFPRELSEQISHIPHGATITVSGEIETVDTTRLTLKDCELVR
jgi:hypothetical protein